MIKFIFNDFTAKELLCNHSMNLFNAHNSAIAWDGCYVVESLSPPPPLLWNLYMDDFYFGALQTQMKNAVRDLFLIVDSNYPLNRWKIKAIFFDRLQSKSGLWIGNLCLSELAVAFSLVSSKPYIVNDTYTFVCLNGVFVDIDEFSKPMQNFVTLTSMSRFSEHTLILCLAHFYFTPLMIFRSNLICL